MSNGKTGPLLCTVCKKAGKRSNLQTYQINFDEAIILCENRECTYPIDCQTPKDIIVKRKFTDIKLRRQKRLSVPWDSMPNSPKSNSSVDSFPLESVRSVPRMQSARSAAMNIPTDSVISSDTVSSSGQPVSDARTQGQTNIVTVPQNSTFSGQQVVHVQTSTGAILQLNPETAGQVLSGAPTLHNVATSQPVSKASASQILFQNMNQSTVGSVMTQAQPQYVPIQPGNLPPPTILSQASNVHIAAQPQASTTSGGMSVAKLLAQSQAVALSRSMPLVSSVNQLQTVSQSGSTSLAPSAAQAQTVVQSGSVSVAQVTVQPQNVLPSGILSIPLSATQSQTVSHFGNVSNASLAAEPQTVDLLTNTSVAQFVSQPQTIIQSGSTSVAQLIAQPQIIIQSGSTSSTQVVKQPTVPNIPHSPGRVASTATPEQQYKLAMLKKAILKHQLLQQRAALSQAANQQGVVATPQGGQTIDPNILSQLEQLGKGVSVSHVASAAVPTDSAPTSDLNIVQPTSVSMPQDIQSVDPNLIGDVGIEITVADVASVALPADGTTTSNVELEYDSGVPSQKSCLSVDPNPGDSEGVIVSTVVSGSARLATSPSESTSVTVPQSVQSNLLNQPGGDGLNIEQVTCQPAPANSSASTTPDLNPNIKYIEITIEQAAKIPGITPEMVADMRLQSQQDKKSPRVLIPFDRLKDIMNQRRGTQIVHVDLTAKTQVPQPSPSRTPQVGLTSPRAQAVPLGRGTPRTAFAKYGPKPQTGALIKTVSVLQKPKISIEMKNPLPPTSQVPDIMTFSSSTTGGVRTVSVQQKSFQPSVSGITIQQVLPQAVAQSTASVVTFQTRNKSQSVPTVTSAPTSATQPSAAPQLIFTDVACNPGDRFIQWRNEDALCWLDVVLSLLVFNKSIRSPVVMNKFDSTNVIRTICAAYDQALNIIRSPSWEEGSPVKASGQVGCIKGMVGTGGGGTEVSTPSSLGSAEGGVLMEKFFDSIDTDKSKCDQTKSLSESAASGEVSNSATEAEIPSKTPTPTSLPMVSIKSGASESNSDSQQSPVSSVEGMKDLPANDNREMVEHVNSDQMETDEEGTATTPITNCDEKLTPVVICDSDEMEAGDGTDTGQTPIDKCRQVSGQSDTKSTGSVPSAEIDTDESSSVVKQLEQVHLAEGEVVDENIGENCDAIDSISDNQSETLPHASDIIPQSTTEIVSKSAQVVTPSGQSNESSIADENITSDAPSTLTQTTSDKVSQSIPTSTSENSVTERTIAAAVLSESHSVSAASASQTETKPAKKPSARFFVPVMASSDPNQQVRHIKFSRPLSVDMKKILALPPEDRQAMVKDLTKEDKDELIHYYIQYLFPGLEIEQYFEARDVINGARDEMWTYLEPRLKCEKGKNDSPMIALYMVLSSIKALKANFLVNATWILQCQICGKKKIERQSKTLITFPNVGPNWTMHNAYFIRACYFCGAPKQKRNMVVKDFPPSVALHFMEGLPSADLETYDFTQGKFTYRVTGCIQYRKFPDHFITWLRDPNTNSWMECDDLKLPVCQYTKNKPSMQPSEVHIVVWERQEFYLAGTDPVQTDIADPEAEISMDSTASSNVSTSKSSMISSTSATLPAVTFSAVTSTPYFALTPPPPTSVQADSQTSTSVMKTPPKIQLPQVVPSSPDVAIIGVSPSPDVAITQATSPPDLVTTHIETAAKRVIGATSGVRRRSADSSRSAPAAKVARLANPPAVSSTVLPTGQQTFRPIQSTSSSASSLSDSILSDVRDAMTTLTAQQNRELSEMMRQIQEIVTKYKLCLKRIALSGESPATRTLKSQLQKSLLNIITRMPPSIGKGLFRFYQQEGIIAENLVLTIRHTSQPPGTSSAASQLVGPTPGMISQPASAALAGIRPVMVPCQPASTAPQVQSPVLRGELTGTTPRVEKSYLKLVQPLLKMSPALGQKGRQRGQYAGYVPRSQRNPGAATTAVISPAQSSMTAAAAAAAAARPQTSTCQQPLAAAPRPQALSTNQQPLAPTAKSNVRQGIQQRLAQNIRWPVQRMITTAGQVVVLADGQGTKIIQPQGQRILGPAALNRREVSVPSTGVIARVVASPSTAVPARPPGAPDEITVADLLRARNPVKVTLSSPLPSSTPVGSLQATPALRTSLHDAPSSDATTAQTIPVSQSSTKTVQSLTSVMTPLEASVAETLQLMASSSTGDVSTAFRAAASAVVSEALSSSSSANIRNVEQENVVTSMPFDAVTSPPDVIQVQPQNIEMEMTAGATSDPVSSTAPESNVASATASASPVQSPDINATLSVPVQAVRTEEVLTASPEPVVSKIMHEPAPLPVVSKMIHVPVGLPDVSSSYIPATPFIPAPSVEPYPQPASAVGPTESTRMLVSMDDPATISEVVVPAPMEVSAAPVSCDTVSSAAPITSIETAPTPVAKKQTRSPFPKVVAPAAKEQLSVTSPTESLGFGKRVRRKPARFLDDDESDSSSMSGKSPSRSSTGSSPKRARGHRRKQSVERSVSAVVLEVQSASESSPGRGRARGRGSVERSVSTPLLDVPILLGDDVAVHQRRGRGRTSGRGRGHASSPVAMDIHSQPPVSLLAQANAPVLPTAVQFVSQPTTSLTMPLPSPQSADQQTEQGRPRRQPTRKCLDGLTPQQLELLKQLQTSQGPGEMVINMDNVQVGADGSLFIVQSADMAEATTVSARSRSDSNDSSQDVTVISGSGDAK
ncbi:uncharacterized protein LOC135503505 [Lineus longissimus]|uniref:uncharacterized protein LOC135503505 n=1 Tax=Lineus longissimus TaxID=88925 RepID=UPI002B4D539E